MTTASCLPADASIPAGTRVQVFGKPTDPWNGQLGAIVEFQTSSGVFVVQIEGGSEVQVPPDAIRQLVANVTVAGDDAAAGDIVRYSTNVPGMVLAEVCPQREPSFFIETDQLVVPVGTSVRIVGLKKSVEHNGKWGHVTGYDAKTGRMRVKCSEGTVLSLKRSNYVA
eukprot:m.146671 g.146671  ORF g.146671 m.146671 type:complete len:168 (-) comp17261_c2_seq2:19-522(-)